MCICSGSSAPSNTGTRPSPISTSDAPVPIGNSVEFPGLPAGTLFPLAWLLKICSESNRSQRHLEPSPCIHVMRSWLSCALPLLSGYCRDAIMADPCVYHGSCFSFDGVMQHPRIGVLFAPSAANGESKSPRLKTCIGAVSCIMIELLRLPVRSTITVSNCKVRYDSKWDGNIAESFSQRRSQTVPKRTGIALRLISSDIA